MQLARLSGRTDPSIAPALFCERPHLGRPQQAPRIVPDLDTGVGHASDARCRRPGDVHIGGCCLVEWRSCLANQAVQPSSDDAGWRLTESGGEDSLPIESWNTAATGQTLKCCSLTSGSPFAGQKRATRPLPSSTQLAPTPPTHATTRMARIPLRGIDKDARLCPT